MEPILIIGCFILSAVMGYELRGLVDILKSFKN